MTQMTRKAIKTDIKKPLKKGAKIVDPKAPKKGEPVPVRGVGSNAGRSREKILTVNGTSLGKNAWARALGISRKTLDYRLKHHPVEIALSPNFREIMLEGLRARGFWNGPHRLSEEGRASLREKAKARAELRRKERLSDLAADSK